MSVQLRLAQVALFFFTLPAFLYVGSPRQATAQAVNLGALGINWNFETPELAHSNMGEANESDLGPGWTLEVLAGTVSDQGVQDPNRSYYGPFVGEVEGPVGTFTGGTLPPPFEGRQLGYINLNDDSVSSGQIVSNSIGGLLAGQTYTLNVAVGARNNIDWSNVKYDIGLRTLGGVELGTFGTTTMDPGASATNIVDLAYALNVNTQAAAHIGQEVQIVVRGQNLGGGSSPPDFTQANFDNVRLSGTLSAPNLPALSINRATGAVTLSKTGGSTFAIGGYQLSSDQFGSFDQSQWTKISVAYDDSGNGSVDANNDWSVLTAAGSFDDLSEAELEGGDGGVLNTAAPINLGTPWIRSPYEDVTASLLLHNGTELTVPVTYVGNAVAAGDLNADGNLNVADWTVFKAGHATDLSAMSIAKAYTFGDMNRDRQHNLSDFSAFRAAYDAANGVGAFEAMIASVPEPATSLLLAAGLLVGAGWRGRGFARAMVVSAVALGLCGMVSPARADLVAGYDFEGSADDVSGNGLHGILRNAATLVSDPLRPGMVLQLDDADTNLTSAYMDITDPTGLLNFSASGPQQGSATVMAWVFSPDFTNHDNIFGQGEWNDGLSLTIKADAGDTLWTQGASRSDIGVGTGAWHHVAATWNYDGTNTAITFYIDGVATGYAEGGTLTGRVNAPVDNDGNGAGNSRLGLEWRDANENNIRWPFNGRLDEVAVFNTALNASEVIGFMNSFPGAVNLDLRVDPATGQFVIYNDNPEAMSISSYEITSPAGSLDAAGWTEVAGQGGFPAGNGSGNGWEPGPAANSNELTEWNLTGSASFGPGAGISLGFGFNEVMNIQDLVFKYTDGDGVLATGKVDYTGIPEFEPPSLPADFDGDGDVDGTDLGIWRSGFGPTATSATGDADADGDADGADFLTWQRNLTGSQAAAAAGPVPEPGSAALLALGGAALALRRRPRRIGVRPPARGAAVVIALLATLLVGSARAAVTNDRVYRMGDESGEGASIGGDVVITWDSQGASMAGQLHDLGSDGATPPSYVDVSSGPLARPGAETFGIQFDGVGDFLSGVRLGNPSTTASTTGAIPLDYAGLRNRGFQLWVRPESGGPEDQSVVRDTDDHGVMIEADGATAPRTWRMRYDEATTNSGVEVVYDQWRHVMVAIPVGFSGPNGGSVLYLNGVAIAADPGDYDAAASEAEDILRVGSNLGATGGAFFKGTLDQLEMFVHGKTTNGLDRGTFNFATDNDFAAADLSGVPGDVDQDGDLDSVDVNNFISGWKSEKVLSGVRVGDVETIRNGDLNLDGIVSLKDVAMMRVALGSAGLPAAALNALGVPEPAAAALAAPLLGLLISVHRRRRRAHR